MKVVLPSFWLSCAIIFLAWIAKLQFVPGGDILFRFGSTGATLALVAQLLLLPRHEAVRTSGMAGLFLVNTSALALLYAGMMLKVAHVLDTQLQKDLVLDLLGIPVLLAALTYSFGQSAKVLASDREAKVLLMRHVLYPWTVFVFSYLFYVVYSVVLARA